MNSKEISSKIILTSILSIGGMNLLSYLVGSMQYYLAIMTVSTILVAIIYSSLFKKVSKDKNFSKVKSSMSIVISIIFAVGIVLSSFLSIFMNNSDQSLVYLLVILWLVPYSFLSN